MNYQILTNETNQTQDNPEIFFWERKFKMKTKLYVEETLYIRPEIY